MTLDISSQVGGRYQVLVHDKDTGVLKADTGWFNNLITNQGLNMIGTMTTSMSPFSYCRVGSGSAVPTNTDVGLQTPLANYANVSFLSQSITDLPNNYRKFSTVYRYNFAAGALVGTIREVTIGWYTDNVTAFSRSLLKDSSGNAIELPVTANDLVSINYEFNVYVQMVDTVVNTTINGVATTMTIRPVVGNSSNADGWSGSRNWYSISRYVRYFLPADSNLTMASTSLPYSTSYASSTSADYVPNSFQRDYTLSISNGSAITIGAIGLLTDYAFTGNWLFIFSPNVVKAANQKVVFVARFKWGRYVA